jgi:hypothetical protein
VCGLLLASKTNINGNQLNSNVMIYPTAFTVPPKQTLSAAVRKQSRRATTVFPTGVQYLCNIPIAPVDAVGAMILIGAI